MLYLSLKALHIIAVISWMAGMLYLPRLFVYHAATAPGSAPWQTFVTMEQRLLRYIMVPAMAVTWIAGIALVITGEWLGAGWFHAKFALVVAMSIMHGAFSAWAHDFSAGRNPRSQKFYRIANEIPTLLMILIVVLAVVKPF